MREGEGIAAQVLERVGVNLEKARTQTILALGQPDLLQKKEGALPHRGNRVTIDHARSKRACWQEALASRQQHLPCAQAALQ